LIALQDVLVAKAGLLEVRRLSREDQQSGGDNGGGGDNGSANNNGMVEDTTDQSPYGGDLASLPLVLEIPIRGRICCLLSFRPPGADRDFIFFTTERHKYAVLSYQQKQTPSSLSSSSSSASNHKMGLVSTPSSTMTSLSLSLEHVVTHDIGMLNDMSVGREAECGPQGVVATGKCIAIHMYDGFVKIFPFVAYKPPKSGKSTTGGTTRNKKAAPTTGSTVSLSSEPSFKSATLNTPTGPLVLGASFQCRLQEHTLLTLVFLMENMEVSAAHPHLAKLSVLHQDAKGFQHVMTHTIDLKKRELVVSASTTTRRSPTSTSGGAAAAAAGAGSTAASSAKPSPASISSTPNNAGPKKSRVDAGSCLIIPVPPLITSPPMAAAAGAAASTATSNLSTSTSTATTNTTSSSALSTLTTSVGTGGLLIIGQMQIMYVSANNTGTKVLPIEPTLILCHTALPQRAEGDATFQCLLADERGLLYLLDIRRNPQTGACTSLIMDTMGLTSIATSLIAVSPTVLFVGSRFGDSQLLQICPQRDAETNSFLQILEEYTNLGPIVDLDLVDLDRKGQSQVVTCSGTGRDGSIRIVRNGIGIHEQAHVELPGIKGMWNLRGASANTSSGTEDGNGDTSGNTGETSGGDQYDRYLVQSFLEETRVLEMTEDEMEETMIAGFRADQPTLFASNVNVPLAGMSLLVQITDSLVILVDATTLEAVDTWKPPSSSSDDDEDEDIMNSGDNKQITVASGNDAGQLVVALRGGILTYLQVSVSSQGGCRLEVKATKQIEHEVSCINLNPLQQDRNTNANVGGATVNPHGDAGGVTSMDVDVDVDVDDGPGPASAGTSDLCAVGLWNDVSVRLLNLVSVSSGEAQAPPLPLLEEVLRLDLGGETQARSLLLASLEQDQPMLLVGLGDGQLISYFLKQTNDSSSTTTSTNSNKQRQVKVLSKKKVSLGTQSISLTAFRNSNSNNGNTCVFATGDRPTIVYMTAGKVLYSNINLTTGDNAASGSGGAGGAAEDGTGMPGSNNNNNSSSSSTTINHVTSFHCELFPDCLCLASEETLRIGTIDDIQKLHVQTYPLRETPQRIAHHLEGRLFAVACLGDGINAQGDNPSALSQQPITMSTIGHGNAILFLDDTTLEDIDR
jgi:DNA damage-binding protein 1